MKRIIQHNVGEQQHVLPIKHFFGKKCTPLVFAFAILICLFNQFALADEIHLRNGDRISGQFVDLSPLYCIFTTSHQATLYIERQELLQLHTTQPVVVELNSSERIVGIIENTEEQGVILLQSERFGTLPVKLTDIMRITRVESTFVTGSAPTKPVDKESISPPLRPLDSSSIQRLPTAATVKNTQPPTQTLLKRTTYIQSSQQSNENEPVPLLNRGEEEDDPRQNVLRQSAVLLKTGEKEIAVGLIYDRDATTDTRTRFFELPLILRLGLTDRLESALRIPVIWSEYTTLSDNYTDLAFGVGDMSLDFNYLFLKENRYLPDIYGTARLGIPTGDEYAPLEFDTATTGSGHWSLFTGMTVAKSYDPAILFAGLGYTHEFKRRFSEISVQPGDSWDYYFGLGLSINPQLALGLQFLGSYQKSTKHNGKAVDLSSEPMYLELSLPYTVSSNNYIEPSLTFGLNSEAKEVILDFYYNRKF